MLKNYFYVALRNIKKYKAFSFINVIGLAVGVACCTIIFLFVKNELSYDTFNKNADRIYRVRLKARLNDNDLNAATSPSPLGEAVKHDLPEVIDYTRIRNFGFPVLRYKDKVFSEEKFYLVDSTFFNVFSVHFLEGNPKTALTKPAHVVITEKMAKKYFGNENPVGKILNADHRRDWIVTGVVKAFPKTSHFHFDFLGSISTYNDSRSPYWLSNNYYTYLLLRKGTNPKIFQQKLNNDAKKYIGPQVQKVTGISPAKFKEKGFKYGFVLQPLTSIHLNSHLDYELEPNSDKSYIYIFSIIALSILLIACVNFVNLSTARSERRAKEVGIRKTLGSNKIQLIKMFIAEAVAMSSLAVFLAVVLVEIFLPVFNTISGEQMALGLFENLSTIPILLVLAAVIGIFAGAYPAFYLSSFKPVKVLKSEAKGKSKSWLRSGLVILQFTVTIILFIGTFIVYNQLKFIQNKNSRLQ